MLSGVWGNRCRGRVCGIHSGAGERGEGSETVGDRGRPDDRAGIYTSSRTHEARNFFTKPPSLIGQRNSRNLQIP